MFTQSLGLGKGECHQDRAGTLAKRELCGWTWHAGCYSLTLSYADTADMHTCIADETKAGGDPL